MEEMTLLFRHLPADLNIEERKDLLYFLGASRVKVMGKTGPMKNTAFAVFGNKEQATQVLNQLHQAELLGSRLVVEFAKTLISSGATSAPSKECPEKSGANGEENASIKREEDKEHRIESQEIKFDSTFRIWGLKHPRRPELRYAYPPPTPSILTNILNALAAVPKFYVQVLHLMNKMDLPAPFGAVTPAPPIYCNAREPTLPDDNDQLEMEISSETESELESGNEGEDGKRLKELRPRKRLPKLIKKRATKRPRLSDLQDSGTNVTLSAASLQVSQVFEMMNEAHMGAKKIELKLPSSIMPLTDSQRATGYGQHLKPLTASQPLPQQNTSSDTGFAQKLHPVNHLQQPPPPLVPQAYQTAAAPPAFFHAERHQLPPLPNPYQEHLPAAPALTNLEAQTQPSSGKDTARPSLSEEQHMEPEASISAGFGILEPIRKEQRDEVEEESADKEWSKSKFISSSELRRSRLSRSEMKEMSVFKNYSEGEPSCRLYIKNVTKNVTEQDIHWIYGRYVDWENEQETNIFDIKLMKEGRMKGQAFVTLPTEESAISAVKDTNGFMLKDKPLVVQFARSAKVKK